MEGHAGFQACRILHGGVHRYQDPCRISTGMSHSMKYTRHSSAQRRFPRGVEIRDRDGIIDIKGPLPTGGLQSIRRPHAAMLPTLARRMAQAAGKATTTNTATASSASSISSPSRLKKVWPPDFSKLSKQEQLHFEKRYKRRVSHIAQRPRWNKMIQLAQLTTITCMEQASVVWRGWALTVGSCRGVQRHVYGLEG